MTRHFFDLKRNDASATLCGATPDVHNLVRMDKSNVNCPNCVGLLEDLSDMEPSTPPLVSWSDLFGIDPNYTEGKPVEQFLEEGRGEA